MFATDDHETIAKSFGERLHVARRARRLTQTALSEQSGIGPSMLSLAENGKRTLSFKNLIKLADALDVSTDFLLNRTENPNTSMDADADLMLSSWEQTVLQAVASALRENRDNPKDQKGRGKHESENGK